MIQGGKRGNALVCMVDADHSHCFYPHTRTHHHQFYVDLSERRWTWLTLCRYAGTSASVRFICVFLLCTPQGGVVFPLSYHATNIVGKGIIKQLFISLLIEYTPVVIKGSVYHFHIAPAWQEGVFQSLGQIHSCAHHACSVNEDVCNNTEVSDSTPSAYRRLGYQVHTTCKRACLGPNSTLAIKQLPHPLGSSS